MNAYTLVSPLFSISEHTEPYKNLSFVSKIIFIIVNHNSPWGPWFGKSNCKKKKWKYFLSLFAFCFHIPLMNEWAQQTVTCDGACACACKFRGGVLKLRIDQEACNIECKVNKPFNLFKLLCCYWFKTWQISDTRLGHKMENSVLKASWICKAFR